jgi:hypothetical protein
LQSCITVILSLASQRTICGPDDVGSGYPAVPLLGWPGREADSAYTVDWRGRLGIRAYMSRGRRGPTVWPVKYYIAPRDIRVNRSNVPVAGGCTWAELVKPSRTPLTTSSTTVLIHVSSCLLTSPDSVWNRVILGADMLIVDRPLQWFKFVTLRHC